MSSAVPVLVHESQFPENIRRDLLESLKIRKVNHKFHYESVKQAQQWLALHEKYSPSRHDPDCTRIYNEALRAAATTVHGRDVHLIGIGSGGGRKDTWLLNYLRKERRTVFYSPCDVSTAMVLTAWKAACGNGHAKQSVIPSWCCFPLICDITRANDLPRVFKELAGRPYPASRIGFPRYAIRSTQHASPPARILTFFGMIPNFEPALILPRLASLIRAKDVLLFSANLAPGPDYIRGVEKILPQYDNSLTREWLMTFLLYLGVERTDGDLRFSIFTENSPLRLRRVQADFHFRRAKTIRIDNSQFRSRAGASIRVFFSYRYTPDLTRRVLQSHGLAVRRQWITRSQEEGVFLVEKSRGTHAPS